MENVVTTPQPERRRTVPLIALVVLVVAAALVAYFIIGRLGQPGYDAAAFLPKECAMAVTVNFASSSEKNAAAEFIRSMFADAGVKEPEKELYKKLSEELKMDFEKDVLAHLNGQGGFAVLTEMTVGMPEMVAVIGARSETDASALMTTLGNRLNKDKIGFARLKHEGVDYYNIPMGQVASCVGAVKNSVVWANSDSAFKKVVNVASGKDNLLSDDNYVKLRNVSAATFGTFYVSGPNYYKLISPFLAMAGGMMAPGTSDTFKEAMENAVAVSITMDATGDGVFFRANSISKKPAPALKSFSADALMQFVPKDTAGVISIGDWKPYWDTMKQSLMDNPMMKQQIDQGLAQAKQMLQLDPLADFLDRITSLSISFTSPTRKHMNGALAVVATLDKPETVKTSAAKIANVISNTGKMTFKPLKAGGTSFSVAATGSTGPAISYAIIKDKLLLLLSDAAWQKSAAPVADLINGRGESAAESDGFKLAKKFLDDKTCSVFYANLAQLTSLIPTGEMSDKDRKIMENIIKKVGVVAATGTVKGNEASGTVVIPFNRL